jgi:putative ABC transport system permease protein
VRAFGETIDGMAGRAALQVTAGDGRFFPEDLARIVAAVPGVTLAVPLIQAVAFVADEAGQGLTIYGMDVLNDRIRRVYEVDRSAWADVEDLRLLRAGSLAIPRRLARHYGLHVGELISLDTPRGRSAFLVRGILDPHGVGRLLGEDLAVMHLSAAQTVFAHPGAINQIDIVVDPGADVTRVGDAVAAVLPPNMGLHTPAQRKADLHAVMRGVQLLLRTMDGVGVLAGFLIAFSGLASVFDGRLWQLGVLRSVGLRRRRLWWELIKESLVIGAIGVAIGIPAGIGLACVVLPTVTAAVALNTQLPAANARLVVEGGPVLLAAITGLAAVLFAAALPGWRAAYTAPAIVVRDRGASGLASTRAMSWVGFGLAAAGITTAITAPITRDSGIWNVSATLLIFLGAAACARPLLRLVGWPLAQACARFGGVIPRLAVGELVLNRRRPALVVATIGVGVGSVLWLWTVASSFERSLTAVLTAALQADLVVTSTHVGSGVLGAPFDDRVLGELREMSGVRGVAGERVVESNVGEGQIALDAFDPVYFTDSSFGRWPLRARQLPHVWDLVASGDAVVVSTNFVRSHGLSVGDTVRFDTPSGSLTLRIAGVTTHFHSPRGTVILSRALYARYWHDATVTAVFVQAARGTDVQVLRAQAAQAIGPKYGLVMRPAAEMVDYYGAQVRRAFAGLYILDGLMLFVVLVGTGDALSTYVVEHTHEIGVLRAVGLRRRSLRTLIVVEAFVLAMLGLGLASVVGLALGKVWVDRTFPLLFGWVVELHIPYAQAATTALLTVTACLLSSVVPARHAAALDPIVALRSE